MPKAQLARKVAVVGTIHSPASLAAARRVTPAQCDYLEARVDHFAASPAPLLAALPRLALPIVVTARHPAEGGMGSLGAAQRRELYTLFIKHAAWIDLELRSCRALSSVVREARAGGVGLILSHHDFRRTPPLAKLRKLARRAREEGADIFKLATLTDSPRDVAILIEFLNREIPHLPLAVMGMGQFGKVSRLVLAQAGSSLNYGFLGSAANASGQWPVALLRQRIAELTPAG